MILFRKNDQLEVQAFIEKLQRQRKECEQQACEHYNFDFENEKPIPPTPTKPTRYIWTRIDSTFQGAEGDTRDSILTSPTSTVASEEDVSRAKDVVSHLSGSIYIPITKTIRKSNLKKRKQKNNKAKGRIIGERLKQSHFSSQNGS